jgi:hypothetical protein
MKSDPRGVVGYVDADVRDPGAIVAGAQGTLDFSQPIAVMLLFTLSYVQDAEEAAKVVSSLMAAVPSGSFLAIYHLASDLDDTMDEAARMWNKMMPTQSIVLRSAAEVGRLVPGLVPVQPGLVPVTDWRPVIDSRLDRADLVPASVPVYGIVARKP